MNNKIVKVLNQKFNFKKAYNNRISKVNHDLKEYKIKLKIQNLKTLIEAEILIHDFELKNQLDHVIEFAFEQTQVLLKTLSFQEKNQILKELIYEYLENNTKIKSPINRIFTIYNDKINDVYLNNPANLLVAPYFKQLDFNYNLTDSMQYYAKQYDCDYIDLDGGFYFKDDHLLLVNDECFVVHNNEDAFLKALQADDVNLLVEIALKQPLDDKQKIKLEKVRGKINAIK